MTKFNSKCRDSFSSSSDRKQKGTDDKEKSYHMITLQNNLLLNQINGSWFLLKMAHLSSSFSLSHLKWLKRILVVGLGNCGKGKQNKTKVKTKFTLTCTIQKTWYICAHGHMEESPWGSLFNLQCKRHRSVLKLQTWHCRWHCNRLASYSTDIHNDS